MKTHRKMTDKKSEFKRKLSGEPVDWKEFAMHHVHLLCEAEMREKEFCWESRYFYNAEVKMNKEMGLSEEQQNAVSELYVKWLEEKGKL